MAAAENRTRQAAEKRRLGESVAERDEAGFVGRTDILTSVAAMLDGDDRRQILFVHGPGGAGKSALLREIARRVRASGRPVQTIDGRLLEVSKDALAQACGTAAADVGHVIIIDSFEQIQALAIVLRDEILPPLAFDTVVIVASRRRPEAFWFRDGWEHVAQQIALRPLRDDEADQLLAQSHVSGDAAARIRHWAKGSPLALHVAASATSAEPLAYDDDLADTIMSRLVGDDLDGADSELLALASVARAVDERLIADVLPDCDARTAYRQLRQVSLTEPYGNRLALHDLVREALRTNLERQEPNTFRRLVCRTADHLHARVLGGEFGLLSEMSELLADPFIRAAYSAGRGSDFSAGRPEAGDTTALAEQLGCAESSWWRNISRFFAEAPELVTVVRSSTGQLVGFGVALTVANSPAWVAEDPVVSALISLAKQHAPESDVPLWRDCANLLADGDPARADVFALLNHPPHLSVDLVCSRAIVGAIETQDANGWLLRTSIGAKRIAGLEIIDGERVLGGYVIDNGPGLLIGNVRDQIYLGQQLTPPTTDPLATTSPRRPTGSADDTMESALKYFHDSVALAGNALAQGADIGSRAEFVRDRLRTALDAAYGPATAQNPLRRIIERGYLDANGGHQRAMSELHVSRSTYFRMLKKARATLAAALADD